MGKSPKRRNSRSARHNPVRVPDTHLPKGLASAAAASSKKSEDILPIIQKLEAPDAIDRIWACSAICNLIQNDPSTRRLLQGKGVVGALITRLSDENDEVVVEAAGALRNLCIDGGHEICAEMYNKNILSPLKSFVPKISSTLSELLASPSSPKNSTLSNSHSSQHDRPRLTFDLAENVITLFWCLSETSNKALTAINNVKLVPFLMSFLLERAHIPLSTVLAAAQCLYVLTDDNSPAIEAVRSEASNVACLVAVANQKHLWSLSPQKKKNKGKAVNGEVNSDEVTMQDENQDGREDERFLGLRVLVCGILRNIQPIPVLMAAAAIDLDKSVILPLLVPLLGSIDLEGEAKKVHALVSQPIEKVIPMVQDNKMPKSDHKSPVEVELERIEMKLRNVQLSLEILTGVCANLPDPENLDGEEGEEDGGDGEWVDDDGDEEGGSNDEFEDELMSDSGVPNGDAKEGDVLMSGAPSTTQSTTSPQALLAALTPPLLSLARPTSLSFPPISFPSLHPPTTSALGAIHVCALECLNNLFLGLTGLEDDPSVSAGSSGVENSAMKKEGVEVWKQVWSVLREVGNPAEVWSGVGIGGKGQERRREVWEIGVGVLWGLARVCKGELIPDETEIGVLIGVCDTVKDEKIKAKCIGTLGCIAQRPDAIDANKHIGSYLLTYVATIRTGPEPLLQAISEMIDIYSDEETPYDVNFRAGQWEAVLGGAKDGVRRAVRRIDRRKEGGIELRKWGDSVLLNLNAFVEYRRKL